MGKQDDESEFQTLFDADSIVDAQQIAIRIAMKPFYTVYVYDTKLQERVRDFDDEKHRRWYMAPPFQLWQNPFSCVNSATEGGTDLLCIHMYIVK